MKLRESGMPEEKTWENLFNVPLILDRLDIGAEIGEAMEVGCGYGTFTLPIARRISGNLTALDIDQAMVERGEERAKAAGIENVTFISRDVILDGLPDAGFTQDAVFLFNILHGEEPKVLLKEAARVLRHGGHVLVVHWNRDPATPRGPSMKIRPKPEQIVEWARGTGYLEPEGGTIDLPPWHYGLRFKRI